MGVNKVIYYGEVLVDMSQVTVTPESLEKGKTALDAKGELITGLHECEETEPNLQEKTVTPTTALQTVNPDSGYDGLSKVTVNAMPTATQATPSISVSSAGVITASATQTAGYVAAGTKSATKQLTTQAAKTVTPTTSNQTAVASGRYTTGAVTVKGDSNLIPANIVSGKSIFGVAGSATTGEDVTTETNAYTTKLAALETQLNALNSELDGKAGGSVGKKTITVTVQGLYNYASYFDEDGNSQQIKSNGQIVEALNGVIFTQTSYGVSLISGNCYVDNTHYNHAVAICTEDGTVLSIVNSGSGGGSND